MTLQYPVLADLIMTVPIENTVADLNTLSFSERLSLNISERIKNNELYWMKDQPELRKLLLLTVAAGEPLPVGETNIPAIDPELFKGITASHVTKAAKFVLGMEKSGDARVQPYHFYNLARVVQGNADLSPGIAPDMLAKAIEGALDKRNQRSDYSRTWAHNDDRGGFLNLMCAAGYLCHFNGKKKIFDKYLSGMRSEWFDLEETWLDKTLKPSHDKPDFDNYSESMGNARYMLHFLHINTYRPNFLTDIARPHMTHMFNHVLGIQSPYSHSHAEIFTNLAWALRIATVEAPGLADTITSGQHERAAQYLESVKEQKTFHEGEMFSYVDMLDFTKKLPKLYARLTDSASVEGFAARLNGEEFKPFYQNGFADYHSKEECLAALKKDHQGVFIQLMDLARKPAVSRRRVLALDTGAAQPVPA